MVNELSILSHITEDFERDNSSWLSDETWFSAPDYSTEKADIPIGVVTFADHDISHPGPDQHRPLYVPVRIKGCTVRRALIGSSIKRIPLRVLDGPHVPRNQIMTEPLVVSGVTDQRQITLGAVMLNINFGSGPQQFHVLNLPTIFCLDVHGSISTTLCLPHIINAKSLRGASTCWTSTPPGGS